MKQLEDKVTADKVDPPKRGRGRPKGVVPPMSDLQRQRERHARLKDAGKGFLTITVDQELLDALDKFVEFKDETKSQVVERILRDRLLRKR